MRKTHFLKNYSPKMAQSLYITEICKLGRPNFTILKIELSPELLTEICAGETESHYNLTRCNDFRIPSVLSVYHSSESISFLGPRIWNILPDEIKQQTSLNKQLRKVS